MSDKKLDLKVILDPKYIKKNGLNEAYFKEIGYEFDVLSIDLENETVNFRAQSLVEEYPLSDVQILIDLLSKNLITERPNIEKRFEECFEALGEIEDVYDNFTRQLSDLVENFIEEKDNLLTKCHDKIRDSLDEAMNALGLYNV